MALDNAKQTITLIGIVGPPGSGKGTQCELLAREYRLEHLSIGDVLRAEIARDRDSPQAKIIQENMALGRVGPPAITVTALKNHIDEAIKNGIDTFVLDGFPRNVEQCEYLESRIAKLSQVIVLDCSDGTIKQRLSERGRWDDLETANIDRRLNTFRETTSKILDVFQAANQLVHVNAEQEIDQVKADLRGAMKSILGRIPLRRGENDVALT